MKVLELSGSQVMWALLIVFLGVSAVIFFYRNYLNKMRKTNLKEVHDSSKDASPLTARTKYPELDVFRYSGTFLGMGLITALLFAIIAFSYTQFEKDIYIPDGALDLEEEIEVEPPRTAEPPPPPPPPPPPVIEEVPEEEIEEEDVVEFQDQSVEEETVVEAPPEVEEKAPPPPPPPPPPKKEPPAAEIFKVVEDMPRFPGCENESSKEAKKQCSDKEMLKFIYKNIKYPAVARENGVEGTSVVTFVVERDGSITDVKVLRDPGAGTGAEAARVVEMMNNMPQKWIPGKQRGQAVRVQFNLPVKFKLEN